MKNTNPMYQNVAAHLSSEIKRVFATEESLKEAYALHTSLPFDRTIRWSNILRSMLRDQWVAHGPAVVSNPTKYDTSEVLRHLSGMLDSNLFTQVLLNLQQDPITYSVEGSKGSLEKLAATWEGVSPSPFEAKPKMFKTASTDRERRYNRDLSVIKAVGIVEKIKSIGGVRSYRVSPEGTTPTLVDSDNVSMLGAGADPMLNVPPGMTAYYLTWEGVPEITMAVDGKFVDKYAPGAYTSSSGDPTILNGSLAARKVAYGMFRELAWFDESGCEVALLPRLNSVLVLLRDPKQRGLPFVKLIAESVALGYSIPSMKVHEGQRSFEGVE